MPPRAVRWAIGAVAFIVLWLIAVVVSVPAIEDDLKSKVEAQLVAAGVPGVTVDFDGRDGTLRGPADQEDAALAAVTDRSGIRSLEYEVVSGAPPATTTAPGEVTVPTAVTTAPTSTTTTSTTTTSTTTTTTTTTTTVPAGPAVDASATIAGQTVALGGFVASDGLRQIVVDTATRAFTPQGEVNDQLEVRDLASAPEADAAVGALTRAVELAGPTLASGTFRATPGALVLTDGEAFSQAAADALNSQLDTIASETGVSVERDVQPAENDVDNLQGSLDALVGRSGISFASGSADIEGISQPTLDSVAELLLEVPDVPIEVRGHTDSAGPAGGNQALSEQRAAAVVDYLVQRGVPSERLTATGAGETEPIAPNDTEEGRARNRRIELIVLEEG